MHDGPRVYRAAPGYEAPLLDELRRHGEPRILADDLFLMAAPAPPCAWAVCTWHEVEELAFTSIGEAARLLRHRGKLWDLHPTQAVRRSQLIRDKLPPPPRRPLAWPPRQRLHPRGAFTLLDEHTLLCAPHTDRPFPGGAADLEALRQGPPARAYRKCQEALWLLGHWPQAGERVYELGAAPGAWTWSLAALGCEVVSIDRAPLDPAVAALPNVQHRIGSAFALDPRHTDDADWIFSDVICYPQRLLTFCRRWLELGTCRKFVITIKFQGAPDPAVSDGFRALGGHLLHLWHNKNELTWIHHPALDA